MASFTLRRFSKPGMLRRIDRKHLIAFLEPHAAYFSARGVELPPVQEEDGLDYNELSHVLLTPDNSTPGDLAEALYYVNEVSTQEGFEAVQAEIYGTELDTEIEETATPADLAIQVWMKDKSIIERVIAELLPLNKRSFEYFKTVVNPLPVFTIPSSERITALENDLDEWFAKKRKGKYSKVKIFSKDDYIWIVVRHGSSFNRESVIESGKSKSQYFRPEKFDVLIYNPLIGEIRMHAVTKGEKELYRKMFGKHLFGDENFFSQRSQFNLESLRTVGEESLSCEDVDGLENVKLKEVQLTYAGAYKDKEIRRSEDFFASLRVRGFQFPQHGRITQASFYVKFKEVKKPRSLTISSGNRASFRCDDDSVILERWLFLRGFITGNRGNLDE